jgi:hypothetical protein
MSYEDRPREDYKDDRGGREEYRERSPVRGNGRCTGVALRWNDRGFGFIKPDDGVRTTLSP